MDRLGTDQSVDLPIYRLPPVNVRFVLRGLLLSLPVVLLIGAAWVWLQVPWNRPPDPTPLPPTIHAPAGQLPDSPVGQRVLARYGDGAFQPASSGFLLRLDSGRVVGVTAAHTVTIGDTHRPLLALAFTGAATGQTFALSDTLFGKPGRGVERTDLSSDYVLLVVDRPVDPAFVLVPDPRGGPQPGERLFLYSGLGDGSGGPKHPSALHRLAGTVQSAGEHAVWVLMDDQFDPALMSGSPLVSQHTGCAVAMAVVAAPRRGALLIGANPIGSLVARAAGATTLYALSEWREELR